MATLQAQHPMLMVTEVVTFGVIVYYNQARPVIDVEKIRQALVEQLPSDCGVSSMTCKLHGQYEPEPRTTAR